MMSTTAEYALRIMIILAESGSKDGGVMTAVQIARETKVPADYTVKVLQTLARAKLVRGRRGRGGGFRVLCDPRRTSLLEIVNAIDPLPRIRTCPLDRITHKTHLCPLHSEMDNIMELMEKRLGAMTIQDVIDGAPNGVLCREDRLVKIGVSSRR
ncbi:MAG: Rrf2 family transcriptional regulator [Phycisphaerales bacterium]|nr:Rrf2 family transcriptional regulator [Phycisphaerales bacterium]